MTKLEKIDREMQKSQEKLAAMQAHMKEVDEQRIEQENLQIVQQIRALKMTREQLRAFVESGVMPASLSVAITNADTAGTQNQTDETAETADFPEPTEPSGFPDNTSYNNSYSSYNDTDTSDDDYYREDRNEDE